MEASKITYAEWQQLVKQALDQTTEYYRFGQALFNISSEIYHIAEKQRGTNADPFYASHENDIRVCNFFDAIVDNQ